MSYVTSHLLCVLCHMSFFCDKVVKLFSGGSVINVDSQAISHTVLAQPTLCVQAGHRPVCESVTPRVLLSIWPTLSSFLYRPTLHYRKAHFITKYSCACYIYNYAFRTFVALMGVVLCIYREGLCLADFQSIGPLGRCFL